MTVERFSELDSASATRRRFTYALITLAVVAVASFAIALGFYAHYFPGDIVAKHDAWGQFGDFLGGALNPLFGFFSFVALLITVWLQSKELALSTEELRKSSTALRDQSTILKQQSFEATFFQLLRIHNGNVDDMAFPPTLKGRDCFAEYMRRLTKRFNNVRAERPSANHVEQIDLAYDQFFTQFQSDVGHYFRTLYTVVKYVDEGEINDKKKYTSIVRALLSSDELALLFYNCLAAPGRERFKPLVEKYALLENMNRKVLLDQVHLRLFEPSAYGDSESK